MEHLRDVFPYLEHLRDVFPKVRHDGSVAVFVGAFLVLVTEHNLKQSTIIRLQ